MKHVLIGIALAGALGCGGFGDGDASTASVVGQVLSAEGAPVANARVLLMADRRPVAEARTGANGRFRLTGRAGELAVLVLTGGDRGSWRGQVQVRPGGETDVGVMEEGVVWAHPEVLWLRDTGFDEQLTPTGDRLQDLGGGLPGEPLFALRQRVATQELVRVADDGSSTVVATRLLDPGSPSVSFDGFQIISAPGCRFCGWYHAGGATIVDSSGTRVLPVAELWWFDAETAESVLQVTPAPSAEVNFLPTRGALVAASRGAETVWHSVAARRAVPLGRSIPVGQMFEMPDGVAVLAGGDDRSVRLIRVFDDGRVLEGESFAFDAQTIVRAATMANGVPVVVASSDAQLLVLRFDPATLAPSTERVRLGPAPFGWSRQLRGPYAASAFDHSAVVLNEIEDGVELFVIGAVRTQRRERRLEGPRPWQLERLVVDERSESLVVRLPEPPRDRIEVQWVEGRERSRTVLPANVLPFGFAEPRALWLEVVDGRSQVRVSPRLGTFAESKRVGRVPFIAGSVRVTDGPWVIASGLPGPSDETSLFRVQLDDEAAR